MQRFFTYPLLLLFGLFGSLPAVGQELVEQAPNIFIQDVFDVSIQPSGAGVAIASFGRVLLTTDFGANWEEREGAVQNPRRIEAIPATDNSFLLLQFGGMERSTDGGLTWTDMNLPDGPANESFSMSSLPSTNVFYAGGRDRVLKTTDGGDSWTAITPIVSDDREWVDIYFFSETEGLLTDDTGVLHYTNNGGTSWTIRNNTSFDERFIVYFRDDSNGYAAHFRDLYQTTDGGISWTLLLEEAFGHHQDQILIIDEQRMIFSQGALSNYITTDGGATMEVFNALGYGGNYGYLHALSDGRVWAAADFGGIGYSEDGGLTYIDQNPGIKGVFLNVDVNTDNQGWAAGRNGQVVRTNNGGENWEPVATALPIESVSEELPSIEYIQTYSFDEVLLTGNRQILRTTDGGNSWTTALATEGNETFDAFSSVDNAIWATESNENGGFIHRSTDKGQSWEMFEVSTEPYIGLRHLYFYNENIGFIAGFSGLLFKTTDGGESWTSIDAFGDDDRLLAPFFLTEQEGWILKDAYGSDLYHTTDGGNTWELLDMGTNTYWQKVHATAENGIYVFGGSSGVGRATRSMDGGQTWEVFISESITSYLDYAYRPADNGFAYWVCGAGGYIGIYDVTFVGVNDIEFAELKAYPNPANELVQLETPANWEQDAQLQVYNLYGQLLHQQITTQLLDVSTYPVGTYLLQLQSGNTVYSTKLSVQR